MHAFLTKLVFLKRGRLRKGGHAERGKYSGNVVGAENEKTDQVGNGCIGDGHQKARVGQGVRALDFDF